MTRTPQLIKELRNTKTDELIEMRNQAKVELHRLRRFPQMQEMAIQIKRTRKLIAKINTLLTERKTTK